MRYLLAILIILQAGQALACRGQAALSEAQVRADSAVLADAEAAEIDRILAFENLRCAQSAAVRDYAFREGRKTGIKSIQGQALFDRLAAKPQISIDLIATDGLSADHYTHFDAAPTVVLKTAGAVADKNCISLSRAYECSTSYAITLVGLNVDFVENNVGTGSFLLGEDGKLTGTVTLKSPALTFPAEIALD